MSNPREYRRADGTTRPWQYPDTERPQGCCYDCGKDYACTGDCTVSDKIWSLINPTHHVGAGLLCANCMIERLHAIGQHGIPATLW